MQFKELAEVISSESIYSIIESFNQTQQDMKWTNHPRIFLEVALVKLCNEQRPNQIDNGQLQQLQQKIEDLEKKLLEMQKNGIPAAMAEKPAEQAKAQRAVKKSYKAPAGKINQVLKQATKPGLNAVKSKWGKCLNS